ncbi:hypothetical protein SELMODRAFT_428790 [Selaginella moellendorffii]|uniref:Uncharacterized protein n=1 Tax=Selaginella moellendorffii TaxID=88036 RepID=D8T406_SELML|nr:hypothetical protein SELMODRAFT_428790 [Selaginella moellendorffii]
MNIKVVEKAIEYVKEIWLQLQLVSSKAEIEEEDNEDQRDKINDVVMQKVGMISCLNILESQTISKKIVDLGIAVVSKVEPARTVVIGNSETAEAVLTLAKKLGTVESVEKNLSEAYINQHGFSWDGCNLPAAAIVFTSVTAARQAIATYHLQNLGNEVFWARQLGGEGSKLKKWRLIVRNLPSRSKGFEFIGYTCKNDTEEVRSHQQMKFSFSSSYFSVHQERHENWLVTLFTAKQMNEEEKAENSDLDNETASESDGIVSDEEEDEEDEEDNEEDDEEGCFCLLFCEPPGNKKDESSQAPASHTPERIRSVRSTSEEKEKERDSAHEDAQFAQLSRTLIKFRITATTITHQEQQKRERELFKQQSAEGGRDNFVSNSRAKDTVARGEDTGTLAIGQQGGSAAARIVFVVEHAFGNDRHVPQLEGLDEQDVARVDKPDLHDSFRDEDELGCSGVVVQRDRASDSQFGSGDGEVHGVESWEVCRGKQSGIPGLWRPGIGGVSQDFGDEVTG